MTKKIIEGKEILKSGHEGSDIYGYDIDPNKNYVIDHYSGIDGRPEYVTAEGWKNSHNEN